MPIFIIGGGPAGMMAAISAAQTGHKVVIVDHNEKLGKKLFITGKGRCNVTNVTETQEYFDRIPRNPKFLYSAFSEFDNNACIRFFEENGVPTKTERGGRVFPASDKSSDIIRALTKKLEKLNVEIRLNSKVREISIVSRAATGVNIDGTMHRADAVVIATGGMSYPSTGSTGDGYFFAENAGHEIIAPKPALVALESNENWVASLQGLALKNIKLKAYQQMTGKNGQTSEKLLFEDIGEMLFTHFGVSGPLVLSASSMFDPDGDEMKLRIDIKPGLTHEQLDARLQRDFEKFPRKRINNALVELMPGSMIDAIVSLSGIPPELQANGVTKMQRQALASLLKNIEIPISGFRSFSEAIITRGGVSVKQVSPSTMESKLCKRLFFAGEILDVDALTGGFNIQIALSTGYLAGKSAAEAAAAQDNH